MSRETFQKGQVVIRRLVEAGTTSEEEAVILHVRKGEVWLDNGVGNSPSGPFSAETGRHLGFELMSSYIIAQGTGRSE